MTKEDYMKLPKERLAEELARRDLISSPSPFLLPTVNQLTCFEDFSKCTNPHHDCINCPHRYSTGGTRTTPNSM